MRLTKEQAIQEHRKMWNWIADQYRHGNNMRLSVLKKLYLKNIYGDTSVAAHCFACAYAGTNNDPFAYYRFNCIKCPLRWPTYKRSSITEGFCTDKYDSMDEMGLYGTLISCQAELSIQEKECIARQIANLPERK